MLLNEMIRTLFCLSILADSLKDLLRFLRRDDQEKRDVFKQVCKWNVVGEKLIPIMEHFPEDRNLVLNAGKCWLRTFEMFSIQYSMRS